MATGTPEDRPPRRPRFTYHPREWSLAGASGTGKTTLAEKLLARWAGAGRRIGFAKHDAHGFQMDQPGKDTWRAAQAGAVRVSIQGPTGWAVLGGPAPAPEGAFLDLDAVLLEGAKTGPAPKILLLDERGWALERLEAGELPEVRALAGPAALRPDPARLERLGCPTRLGALARPGSPASPLPWFDRDDVAGLAAFIEADWDRPPPPLKGLVLGGGRSRRMGQDKAGLTYAGRPQAQVAADLLAPYCAEVFLSVRADQTGETWARDYPLILDKFLDLGPLSGILSALQSDPAAAWLVVACDQPRLDPATLAQLVAARRPQGLATAFHSPFDGRPEPLCTIYEPLAYPRILQLVGLDQLCPRRVLEGPGVRLLDPPRPEALDNINTPEESAGVALAAGVAPAARAHVTHAARQAPVAGGRP